MRLADAGHFQFLDHQSLVQQAVCAQGVAGEAAVRRAAQAVMLAWADAAVPWPCPTAVDADASPSARTRPPPLPGARARAIAEAAAALEGAYAGAGRDPFGRALQLSSYSKGLEALDEVNAV